MHQNKQTKKPDVNGRQNKRKREVASKIRNKKENISTTTTDIQKSIRHY
jgi:hypothetical protein